MKETLNAFRAEDDPVRDFCQSHLTAQPACLTPKADVYQRYQEWCGKQGATALPQRMFGGIVTGITDATPTRLNRTVEAYKGIQLGVIH